jgi:hypothetical protein
MEWREVSITQYALISKILEPFGPVRNLSDEDLRDILRQLQHLETHVYEVNRIDETPDEIAMTLDFLRVGVGV